MKHRDGRAELIATYELEINLERVEVPVVVGWDDRSQRYVPMRHRSAARVLKEEGARFARAAIGGGSVNGTCLL